uniref:Collagen type VI alpha 6 chain n=1 Tax=Lepisosteus oculatus TaxID=7918 RepID=W5M0J7_LEPOC|nr:PREDICTED: collagen alpha-6(VI) chain [Lepisosteus oculatus]
MEAVWLLSLVSFLWVPSCTAQKPDTASPFADVVFLIDSSQQVEGELFKQVKNFLIKVAGDLDIGTNKYRIGISQFSDDAKEEIFLNTFKTKSQVINYIRKNFVHKGGNLKTGTGLTHAYKVHFNESFGSRKGEGYPQFLVVVTSGKSQDDIQQAVTTIKNEGVKIIAIGLQNSDPKELKEMGMPHLTFQNVSLIKLSQNMTNIIKNEVQNHLELMGEPPAVCNKSKIADIVFLVDNSTDNGIRNFLQIQSFLYKTVSSFNVSNSTMRIGLAMYSDQPHVEFYLNSYGRREDVLQHIKELKYSGAGGISNTSAALRFAAQKLFTKEKGSRTAVHKIAVLITDNQSTDNVSEAATALRRAGVTVFAVGIQNADKDELSQIVSHPPGEYLSTTKTFLQLSGLQEFIATKICSFIIRGVTNVPEETHKLKRGCLKQEADIYFLIDGSTSIGRNDFEEVKTFLIGVVDVFNIGPDHIRIGIAQYSTDYHLEFRETEHSSKKKVQGAIENIRQQYGNTYTGKALGKMQKWLKTSVKIKPWKVPQFLITLTDGASHDPVDVNMTSEQLRRDGVITYAIGVGAAVEKELKAIAGSDHRYKYTKTFDFLKDIKNDIAQDICFEEACKKNQADIVFLIDSSGSIKSEDYQKMKDFMKKIIQKLDIGRDKVRIGAKQYCHLEQDEFELDDYSQASDLMKAVDGMNQLGGGTLTGQALHSVSKNFQKARKDVNKILIVITDGEAQDEVLQPAAALRNEGIFIFSIGVFGANYVQLEEISGSPANIFYIQNYEALFGILDKVIFSICIPKEECLDINVADIMFVIDTSSSISPTNFESMKDFMYAVVNNSDIGEDKVRIGATRYSNQTEKVFDLKENFDKQSLIQAIRGMTQLTGETYTAAAMNFSMERLGEAFGGRKKVSQLLVTVTDGKSHDRSLLNETSQYIRQSGIITYAIGIKNASEDELLVIGGSEDHYFYVEDFDKLKDIYKNFSSIICKTTPPYCEHGEVDIVFLIDGSSSIDPGDFATMKTFIRNVADGFDITNGKAQIGLAQYSHQYTRHFNLGSFKSKSAFDNEIDQTQQIYGNTLIGAALGNVKEFFTRAAGSRKHKGVEQYLLVITDGESQDSVSQAAQDLRKDNINLYALGVGRMDATQLTEIAGSPDRVYKVDNFDQLDHIKKRLSRDLCDQPFKPTNCSVDIAVGIDITNQAVGTSLLSVQHYLDVFLLNILQEINSPHEVSCTPSSPIQISFGFSINNTDKEYNTKFQNFKKDFIDDLIKLRVKEPSLLNKVYLESLWEKLKRETKSNTKVILIFTDGLDENIETLEDTSKWLRAQGLDALITVALRGTSAIDNLKYIEFGRGYEYEPQLVIENHATSTSLYKIINSLAEKSCCEQCCSCLGSRGPLGPYGLPGRKGAPGPEGNVGHMGDEGPPGTRGSPGLPGSAGSTGCDGLRGLKGARGSSGEKGQRGEDGLDGIQGKEGANGFPGQKGEHGVPGRVGRPGTKGMPGERGEQGLRGDPGVTCWDSSVSGEKGQSGQVGTPGDSGIDGGPGEKGSPGKTGSAGHRGQLGEKGNKGSPGSSGPIGERGIRGPQGLKGDVGENGPPGENGPKGPQGAPGKQGPEGSKGDAGERGRKGEPGEPGLKGETGPVGPRGDQGEDGKDKFGVPGKAGKKGDIGFQGFPGMQGAVGDKGEKGDNGPKGIRGKRGDGGPPGVQGDPGIPGYQGPKGLKGQRGEQSMPKCDLINYIRANSACASGRSDCPVYPTDLVIAIDMSTEVTPKAFNKMRNIASLVLDDLFISESNCPIGARVAVLSYSSNVKQLIRFADYRKKKLLLEAIKNIAFQRSGSPRDIGAAMSYTARHIFKRTRMGALVKRMAVFLTDGSSKNTESVHTGVLELNAMGITTVVIASRKLPNLQKAFSVEPSNFEVVIIQEQNPKRALSEVRQCYFCYDECSPDPACNRQQGGPPIITQEVDVAFLLDGSHQMAGDEFERAADFLHAVLNYFAVGDELHPSTRLALFQSSTGPDPIRVIFGFPSRDSLSQMKRKVRQELHHLQSSSGVGSSLQWIVNNFFTEAARPRRAKVIFTILGGRSELSLREKLKEVSLKAKCQGIVLFTLAFGRGASNAEVEQLSALPVSQHSCHVGRVVEPDIEYALKFTWTFFRQLAEKINMYPHKSLAPQCRKLNVQLQPQGDDAQVFSAESTIPMTEEQQNKSKDFKKNRTVTQTSPSIPDRCLLTVEYGTTCKGLQRIRWYYNKSRKNCLPFWYGGCFGNENRFISREMCLRICTSQDVKIKM